MEGKGMPVLRGSISGAGRAEGRASMRGPAGANGRDGAAATVTVGSVTTGAPGSQAQVTNSGTESAAVLDFVIPRGSTGPAGSGSGDMTEAVYDPAGGARQVAFASDLSAHAEDADIHVTASEKATWNGKQSKLEGAPGQVVGFDADGSAQAQAMPAGGLSGEQYDLLLTMGGWYTDGSYRAQQVTKDSSGAALSALKASYAISPDVDCSLSGTDAEGDAAIVAGWALVHMAETGAGKITFKCCGDAPEVNIPVILRVFE